MDILGSLFNHQINWNFAFYSSALALASNPKRLSFAEQSHWLCQVSQFLMRKGLDYHIQQAVQKTSLGILMPDNFEVITNSKRNQWWKSSFLLNSINLEASDFNPDLLRVEQIQAHARV